MIFVEKIYLQTRIAFKDDFYCIRIKESTKSDGRIAIESAYFAEHTCANNKQSLIKAIKKRMRTQKLAFVLSCHSLCRIFLGLPK